MKVRALPLSFLIIVWLQAKITIVVKIDANNHLKADRLQVELQILVFFINLKSHTIGNWNCRGFRELGTDTRDLAWVSVTAKLSSMNLRTVWV